ncbi:hypothetical protein DMJ13_11260 [halophilic archaeon]|nr:hypothetical protein DMJ13_11260 [halophilic archaeon]
MARGDARDGQSQGNERRFSEVLSRLKSTGAALLVVGDLPHRLHARACRQMLGSTAHATRRRLFVSTTTGPSTGAFEHSTLPADESKTQLIRYETTHRSTAASRPAGDISLSTTVLDGSLGELGIEISRAIERFNNTANGLDAAELRLCFDSLTPLLDRDREMLFQFLHVLIGRVKSVNGMSHFHLPRSRTTEAVAMLESLFDAIVELRLQDEMLQQRWHFPDEDWTTRWLSPSDPS